MDGSSDLQVLLMQLSSSNPASREQAAVQLAESGDPRAIGPLILATGDRYSVNRLAAATALDALGEPLGMVLFNALAGSKDHQAVLLETRDTRVVPALLGALNAYREGTRERASRLLATLADLVDPHDVRPLLDHLEADVRVRAVRLLGDMQNERGLPLLKAALLDISPSVRERAALSLARFEPNGASTELVAAYADPGKAVRLAVVHAMGSADDPQVVPYLLDALDDPRPAFQQEAARALTVYADPRAYPRLMELAESPVPGVRAAAATSLGRLNGPNIDQALLFLAGDRAGQVRSVAAEALKERGDPRGLAVAGTLDGSQQGCRELIRYGDDPMTAALTRALYYRNGAVRRAAANCLGEMNRSDSVADLLNMANSWNVFDQVSATTALIRIDQPLGASLMTYLRWFLLPSVIGPVFLVLSILFLFAVRGRIRSGLRRLNWA